VRKRLLEDQEEPQEEDSGAAAEVATSEVATEAEATSEVEIASEGETASEGATEEAASGVEDNKYFNKTQLLCF